MLAAVAVPPTLPALARRVRGLGGPVPASPAAEELLETLMRLEPGARLVRLAPGESVPRSQQRVFVPDRDAPVLLSSSHPRALATARRRVDATTAPRDAAAMLGTRAWTTLTGGALLRDRVAVVGGSGSLVEHLAETLGRRVTYSMRIDEVRSSRRPVLQILDGRGVVIAHAALGVSRASRLDLDAEAAALAMVGAREWTHLAVPQVLARTTWQGIDVLVTSALRTPTWQGRASRRAEAPVEAMAELSAAWSGESARLDEMAWTARQQEVAETLHSPTSRRRFGGAVDRLLTDARRTTWPVGAWHGDWTARHTARRGGRGGSRVQVWGWSRFETDAPMGLDPCHWTVAAATERDGFTPAAVRDGLREALRRQHGPGASVLGALYLVAVTSRDLVLAEGPGGHRVAERAEVLLTALESWFDQRA